MVDVQRNLSHRLWERGVMPMSRNNLLGCLMVIGIGLASQTEAAAQMHGVPGAPQTRVTAFGAQRPMAGSSVPMPARQLRQRPGQSLQAATPQGGRFTGRFSSSQLKNQTMSGVMGAAGGGMNAEALKQQVKSSGRGNVGF
jgi:hypothetical protein